MRRRADTVALPARWHWHAKATRGDTGGIDFPIISGVRLDARGPLPVVVGFTERVWPFRSPPRGWSSGGRSPALAEGSGSRTLRSDLNAVRARFRPRPRPTPISNPPVEVVHGAGGQRRPRRPPFISTSTSRGLRPRSRQRARPRWQWSYPSVGAFLSREDRS